MNEAAKELALFKKMNKIAEESHGGYAGKSLVEKLKDDLDEALKNWMTYGRPDEETYDSTELARLDGICDGIAHALGVLCSSSADVEYNDALNRYQNRITTESPDVHV